MSENYRRTTASATASVILTGQRGVVPVERAGSGDHARHLQLDIPRLQAVKERIGRFRRSLGISDALMTEPAPSPQQLSRAIET